MRKAVYILLTALFFAVSCEKQAYLNDGTYDSVLVICTVAYNNLSSDVNRNVKDICNSMLPMKDGRRALLLLSHTSVNDSDFETPTRPCLVRISTDWTGHAILDTIKTWPENAFLTDAATLREGLQYVKDNFPTDTYSVVYSSHGTGWLPCRYYDLNSTSPFGLRKATHDDGPKVKSIGCEGRGGKTSTLEVYETDILDFKNAFPMHLECLVLDACLMGGVEVVYELKDVADKIVCSQVEILATGFDYSKVAERLLAPDIPDAEGFAKDYFDYYMAGSGSRQSAAISVIMTGALPRLAAECRDIFEKYRSQLARTSTVDLQYYFRNDKHWFYDLDDILVHAGVSGEDLRKFEEALGLCISYKAATPMILSTIPITNHSGLSSYLPCRGSSYLDSYYRNLAWNKATGFVK